MSRIGAAGMSFAASPPLPLSAVREIKTCELCGGLFVRPAELPDQRTCRDCGKKQQASRQKAALLRLEIAQLASESARFKPFGTRGGHTRVANQRQRDADRAAAGIALIDYFGG